MLHFVIFRKNCCISTLVVMSKQRHPGSILVFLCTIIDMTCNCNIKIVTTYNCNMKDTRLLMLCNASILLVSVNYTLHTSYFAVLFNLT